MSDVDNGCGKPAGPCPKLQQNVLRIVKDVLQIDGHSHGDTLLRNEITEWDSVSHLRLALELEDAFAVSLDDDQWVGVNSVDDITTLLSTLGAQSPAAQSPAAQSPAAQSPATESPGDRGV